MALPEENGIMIFTGSTVVDENNTSGFCTGGEACLVAVYTGHTRAAGTAARSRRRTSPTATTAAGPGPNIAATPCST